MLNMNYAILRTGSYRCWPLHGGTRPCHPCWQLPAPSPCHSCEPCASRALYCPANNKTVMGCSVHLRGLIKGHDEVKQPGLTSGQEQVLSEPMQQAASALAMLARQMLPAALADGQHAASVAAHPSCAISCSSICVCCLQPIGTWLDEM